MEATKRKENTATSTVKQDVITLINHLCSGLHEREEVVKLSLLAAIAGESIFLLGPPGVGKSLIARRLKNAFADGKSFEYLMTKFSTPDEVFGPVSIKKLKDEDRFERKTDNYLPGAQVVFLDEIWKSSSAIQNALLTVVNEKVYRNGEQEVKVAMNALITASNELPPNAEGFGPLWDRLLIRYELDNIKDAQRFFDMITSTEDVYEDPVPSEHKLNLATLKEWQMLIPQVEVPVEVLHSLQMIRKRIDQWNAANDGEALLIHDRRWKKIIHLLRTSAFLNGRSRVDLMDAFLMLHCLWNQPHQQLKLREIIASTIRDHGYSIALPMADLQREVKSFEQEVKAETTVVRKSTVKGLKPVQDEYYELKKIDSQFEGKYIKVNHFNKLSKSEVEVVNFYDDNFSLVNRLNAKKSADEFAITVTYNSQETSYPLETQEIEKEERIQRKPHELIVHHWNERYAAIVDEMHAAQEKLRGDDDGKWLEDLQTNIFIDTRLAPLVKANHEEVSAQLKGLLLRMEKARFQYEEQA